MSYINYCIRLTEDDKLDSDEQVQKNIFELKFAIFFFPFSLFPMPQAPLLPVEGFLNPQQIVREARGRAEAAVEEKLRPLAETVDDCTEAYNEYKDAAETIKSAENLLKQNDSTLMKIKQELGKGWKKEHIQKKI